MMAHSLNIVALMVKRKMVGLQMGLASVKGPHNVIVSNIKIHRSGSSLSFIVYSM